LLGHCSAECRRSWSEEGSDWRCLFRKGRASVFAQWEDAPMSRQQRAKARRLHHALTEYAEWAGEPLPPPLVPSRKTMLRALLTVPADVARAFLGDPIGSFLRSLVTIKVAVWIVGIAVVAGVLLFGSSGSDAPDHGYTAVCKDGAVLPPPDNLCGAAHGYLDHWAK
jgi:hypothetical protein